jgi:glycosyltransferase involved in cell wall biosynthesis
MVDGRPIRVTLDAHAVGRRLTGNETYVLGLARGLRRRPDVDLTVLLDPGAAFPADPGGDPPPTSVALALRRPQVRIPIELPVRARHARADILHVQYVAPPIVGTRLAVAVHDLSFEDLPDLFPTRTRLRLQASVRASVTRADVVLALSDFTRERILARYGPPPEKVVVAPAGVDGRFRAIADDERAAARSRLAARGVPERFVLHVGDLIPRKNVPRLAEAVGRVRTAGHDDLALVLAGHGGRDAPAVLAAAAAADPSAGHEWVRQLGYVADDVLVDLMAAAAVVAYPSRYEGFGLPALEALATGAVLVTDTGTGVGEVVADAALTTDVDDPAALAAALERALTDEAVRARLRLAGPQRAASFTWERTAASTVAGYRIALDR